MLFPAAGCAFGLQAGPLSFTILNNSCQITWVSAVPGIAPTRSRGQQGNTAPWLSSGDIRGFTDVLKDIQNLWHGERFKRTSSIPTGFQSLRSWAANPAAGFGAGERGRRLRLRSSRALLSSPQRLCGRAGSWLSWVPAVRRQQPAQHLPKAALSRQRTPAPAARPQSLKPSSERSARSGMPEQILKFKQQNPPALASPWPGSPNPGFALAGRRALSEPAAPSGNSHRR